MPPKWRIGGLVMALLFRLVWGAGGNCIELNNTLSASAGMTSPTARRIEDNAMNSSTAPIQKSAPIARGYGEFKTGRPTVLAAMLGIGPGLSPVPFYTIGMLAPELAKALQWPFASIMGGLLLLTPLAGCGGGSQTGALPPTPTPGISAAKLDAAATYMLDSGARAVVVIENGVVVLERYANGGAATRGEALASGTKSFSCALMVGAEAEGSLSIDELASSVVVPWRAGGSAPQSTDKQQIRIRDLLSVSSGLLNSGVAGSALNTVDSYAQAFIATSAYAPNVATIYTPNNAQALSAIFSLKRGGSFDAAGVARSGQDGIAYLQTKVFTPLGVAPTEWARDANGNANFAGGASFTARDWAKFGQFSYQYGAWNGVQILPAAAMRRCFEYRSGASASYGFGWWLNRPAGTSYVATRDSTPWTAAVETRWTNGGKIAPSAPDDMAIAFGAGNRKLYISPSLKLSIAVIAGTNDDEAFLSRLFN